MSTHPSIPSKEIARKRLGQELAAARKNAGLTQLSLSKKLNCNVSVISKMEQGRRLVYPDQLVLIARALNVPPGTFICAIEEGLLRNTLTG